MRRVSLIVLAGALALAAAPAPRKDAAPKVPYPLCPEHYEAVRGAVAGKGDVKAAVEALDKALAEVIAPPAAAAPAAGKAPAPSAARAPAPAAQLRGLFALRRAAEVLARAADRDTALFVLDNATLCGRFLHALDDQDDLNGALGVLKTLRDLDPALFEKQYEFCIAYAVVWDKFRAHWWLEKKEKMEPDTMVKTYKFYAENEKVLKLKPSQLPFELAVYVVGTRLRAEERAWVLANIKPDTSPEALYQSVPWTQVLSPAHGKGDQMDYTLMNIRKVGGVCMEQAYFTESVLRLFGVPAIFTHGRGRTADSGHAWIGSLAVGAKAEWDFTCGRYREHHYFKGEVEDPTDMRRTLTDSIVKMSGALLKAGSIDKIEEGNVYLDAARWAAARLPDDVATGKTTTRADLVQSLLVRSLEASPYNGGTWMHLADLAAAKQMDPKAAGFWVEKLFEYTVRDFPDFTVDALEKFLACLTDVKQKAAVLARVFNVLKTARPDLASDIKVAEGDIWLAQGDLRAAILAYLYPMVNFSQDMHVLEKAKERLASVDQKAGDARKTEPVYLDILKTIAAVRKPDPMLLEARDILLGKLADLYAARGEVEKAHKFRGLIGQK